MCADSTLVQDPVNKKCAITVANGQQLQCEMHEDDVPGSCVSCLTGKMHESSYPRSSGGRAAHPLDLIHSDEDLRLSYEAQIGNGTTSLPLQSPLSDVYRTASEDSTEDDDDEAEIGCGLTLTSMLVIARRLWLTNQPRILWAAHNNEEVWLRRHKRNISRQCLEQISEMPVF
ncbi:unnamed protein product, partial [Brenthis ino]